MTRRITAYLMGAMMPFLGLGFFVIQDINPSGMREAEMTPVKNSPFMYQPLPADRIEGDKKEGYYKMTGDPVYFVLRLPETEYTSTKIEMTYKLEGEDFLKVGPESADGSQEFDLRSLTGESEVMQEDGWRNAEVVFESPNWWEVNRPFVRMAISAPQTKTGDVVLIQSIRATFEKEKVRGLQAWAHELRTRIPFGM